MSGGNLWSYITGVRGTNRIRVYERREGGSIYIEWYDRAGRHQKALTSVAGSPVTDKDLARQLADEAARAQRKHRTAEQAHKLLGMPEPRTLKELFDQYHADHPDWGKSHEGHQKVNRRFWLKHLGADTLLQDVNAPKCVRAIQAEEEVNDRFGSRTQEMRLRYIHDAYTYAVEHLKWLTPQDDLKPLKKTIRGLGSKKSRKAYTEEQVQRLLPAAEKVDLRVAVLAHLVWASGRRPNAVHALCPEHYTTETVETGEGTEEFGVINFDHEDDKAGKEGQVYVYGRTKALVEALLRQPAVQTAGTLFPSGELDDSTADSRVSREWLRQQWEAVEQEAGVDKVRGRAYYGLKRRYATAALRADPQAASQQSGVTEAILRQHYEQDNPEARRRLAKHMDALVTNGNGAGRRKVDIRPVKVPDAFGTTTADKGD